MKILIKRFEKEHKRFCIQSIKKKKHITIREFYLNKFECFLKTKNTQKAKTMLYIILALKKINSYQEEIQKLQYLKKFTVYFKVSLTSIETKEKDISIRINDLKRMVANRFYYLLNLDEKKIFCESFYDSKNKKWRIIRNSVTSYPIQQLGTADLKKGLVYLTRARLTKYKGKIGITLIDYILDLYSGNLYKTNNPC